MKVLLVVVLAAVAALAVFLWMPTAEPHSRGRELEVMGGTSTAAEDGPAPELVIREALLTEPSKDVVPSTAEAAQVGNERGDDLATGHAFLVMAEDGNPLPGAALRLHRRPAAAPIHVARTDRFGRAALDAKPGDEVVAEAEGHLPRRATLGSRPWSNPVPIALEVSTVFLRGLVTDEAGAPIGGARLSLAGTGWTDEAFSDQDGTVRLPLPRSRTVPFDAEFSLVHGEFYFPGQGSPVEITVDVLEREINLRMERWARARLRVLDEAQAPLPGVAIQLVGPPTALDRAELPPGVFGNFVCGSGGEAEFLLPPGHEWWVILRHPERETRELALGRPSPGERIALEVILARGAHDRTWRFQVVDPAGAPLPQAQATLYLEQSSALLRLDEEARFQVAPPAAPWRIQVRADGFEVLEREERGSAPPRAELEFLVLEPAEPDLVLRVEGLAGPALAGLLVEARELPDGLAVSVLTDAEGMARFYGLVSGRTYRVGLGFGRPGGYLLGPESKLVTDPAAHVLTLAQGAELRFDLVPPAQIEGVVRTQRPTGKPVQLTCIAPSAPRGAEILFTISTNLDEGGNYFFGHLPPGRYRLWMDRPDPDGGLSSPLATWDLGPGQALKPQDVEGL